MKTRNQPNNNNNNTVTVNTITFRFNSTSAVVRSSVLNIQVDPNEKPVPHRRERTRWFLYCETPSQFASL
jgi:hypothetical protein